MGVGVWGVHKHKLDAHSSHAIDNDIIIHRIFIAYKYAHDVVNGVVHVWAYCEFMFMLYIIDSSLGAADILKI